MGPPHLLPDALLDPHILNTTLNYVTFHSLENINALYPHSNSLYAAFTDSAQVRY